MHQHQFSINLWAELSIVHKKLYGEGHRKDAQVTVSKQSVSIFYEHMMSKLIACELYAIIIIPAKDACRMYSLHAIIKKMYDCTFTHAHVYHAY